MVSPYFVENLIAMERRNVFYSVQLVDHRAGYSSLVFDYSNKLSETYLEIIRYIYNDIMFSP